MSGVGPTGGGIGPFLPSIAETLDGPYRSIAIDVMAAMAEPGVLT